MPRCPLPTYLLILRIYLEPIKLNLGIFIMHLSASYFVLEVSNIFQVSILGLEKQDESPHLFFIILSRHPG